MEKSIERLKDIPLFKYLSKKELSLICKLGKLKKYKKGEVIIYEGEKGDAIYLINKGEVKVSLISDDGREITLTFLKEGDFFGEVGFFGDEKRTARVTARKDTEVIIYHRDDLLYSLIKNPETLLSIIKELTERIKKTDEKLSSFLFLDVSGRIARFFIEKAKNEGKVFGEYIYIPHNFKIKEIAEIIGCSRESVSRAINEMKKNGVLKFYSKGIFIHKSSLKE